jgi:hypothetical protein
MDIEMWLAALRAEKRPAMSAVVALVSGSLWRNPASRTAKATGKTFVTCLLKSGTPAEPVWCKVVSFDETPKAELLRLKAGEHLVIQGAATLGVFEKAGEHRASLEVVATHVLALLQPRATKSKQARTATKPDNRGVPSIDLPFDDRVPF